MARPNSVLVVLLVVLLLVCRYCSAEDGCFLNSSNDMTQLMANPNLHSTSSSITVSWTPPQLTPCNYTVSYSCHFLCGTQQTPGQATVDGGNATHITSLNAGSSCTVNVTAVFVSHSSNTVTSSTNTTSAAPTGAPGGLNSTSVESRSLTVVWGTVPCPQQGGPITSYRLSYNSSNGSSNVNITVEENREYNLTGLTPYTNYSVQVAAVNDGGTGPYNESVFTVETLQEVPGPVSNLSVSPGVVQLTISWIPPSEPNGLITDYEVGSNSSGVFNYTNTSDTQLTLRDIPPNTVVAFSVKAYTIIGPGENVPGHASTSDNPRISSVSAVPLNSTAVNVSWTPVNLTNHSTVYYTVHYTIVYGSGEGGSGTVHFPVTVSSGVVSGLQEGQWYWFNISVTFNVCGQSFSGIPVSSQPIGLPLSQGSKLAAASGVIALMFIVAVVICIIRLMRRLLSSLSESKPSPGTASDAVFDKPELPTKSGDMEMVQCVAYSSTHHQLQQSHSDAEYEPISLQ